MQPAASDSYEVTLVPYRFAPTHPPSVWQPRCRMLHGLGEFSVKHQKTGPEALPMPDQTSQLYSQAHRSLV